MAVVDDVIIGVVFLDKTPQVTSTLEAWQRRGGPSMTLRRDSFGLDVLRGRQGWRRTRYTPTWIGLPASYAGLPASSSFTVPGDASSIVPEVTPLGDRVDTAIKPDIGERLHPHGLGVGPGRWDNARRVSVFW